MEWIKKGRLFTPNGQGGWINHAQGPSILIKNDRLRVYFAARPKPDISLPVFIDIDKNDFSKILHIQEKPILDLGGPGEFDEFGIIPTFVIELNNKIFIYYTGWSRGITVSYILSIGLAVSEDGGSTFKKIFKGPIMRTTKEEPFMAMAPWIVFYRNIYHMYYGSGIGFFEASPKHEPRYIIKYAHSTNGIDWVQPNKTIISPLSEEEANTRPTIAYFNNMWHMWFCFRGSKDYRNGVNSYKIGYAYSHNLVDWNRDDTLAGISCSNEGWDDKMITYPYVINLNNKTYMFYNGNGFGSTGFGYAELKK